MEVYFLLKYLFYIFNQNVPNNEIYVVIEWKTQFKRRR